MKLPLPLIVPAAVAAVLIVCTTIVQGLWTDRFDDTASEELEAFAEVLMDRDKVLEQIGDDWETQETHEMEPLEQEAAGAVGELSRKYRNPHTQEEVSVYLICGASRNVAIHTPDACYTSSGFDMEGKIQPYTIEFGDASGVFQTAVFLKADKSGGETQRLRVFWAWSANGTWEAPKFPRMKYGGRTPLNKVYFIARSPSGEQTRESSSVEFAKEFLPVVTRLLFPPDGASEVAEPSTPDSDSDDTKAE